MTSHAPDRPAGHRPLPRRWAFAILLASLGMLGPFSVDTYLPAFADIGTALQATPLQMQQTLSAYLLGFSFMNLFHGAISDSIGRRPVVLVGITVFTLASIGCALAPGIGTLVAMRALQGMSTGAGIVVSRAVIRDLYAPADAQRMMSQVTLWFGVAPAVAPMAGGVLAEWAGWRAIFWLLTAVGVVLWLANWRWLPESLPRTQRQSFDARNLLRGYRQLGTNLRFVLLALASGIPFNGMFLYVCASPVFLGEHVGLAPSRFFWFFVVTVAGIMAGAFVSGRLAGRLSAVRQIRLGFGIMAATSLANLAIAMLAPGHAGWSLLPISLYAAGWAINAPAITLLALDVVPERRGMASSLQAVISSAFNAFVAGVVTPAVMHSVAALGWTATAMLAGGLLAWMAVPRAPRHRPETPR